MVKGNKLTERHCKLRDGFGPAGKERDADETKTDVIGLIFAVVYNAVPGSRAGGIVDDFQDRRIFQRDMHTDRVRG